MKRKPAFTLIELLVVIAVIAVLMGILMPALTAAREQGKRAVCLSNLKQLTMAWVMYANENNGDIADGDVGYSADVEANWWIKWPVSKAWTPLSAEDITEEQWLIAITKGQIYPYCSNPQVYRCKNAPAQYKVTYAVVDSMKGTADWGDYGNYDRLRVTNINKIKRPSERLVFLDESPPTPGTWGVKYATPSWWDPPPKLHNGGTTFSFADGHSEFWKWSDPRTAKVVFDRSEPEQRDNIDLQRVQKGVWGKLGYTPGEEAP